jgi:catechol 2,3-dioxygenase-like lactoylglutathione lyase family enzyme
MLETLDHVILAVGDLGAATRTWGRLLGRRPSWVGEHAGAGTRNTLFRLENTYLQLLAPDGPGAVGDALRAWLEARGEGPLGLAFGCGDAEACRTRLEAQGLAPGAIEKGIGRDVESGAFREWLRVPLPLDRTRGVLLFAIEHRSPAELLPLAGAVGGEAATVHGLDHVVVQTRDPEATIALYRDGLGLRLALDRTFEAWGMRLLFFRVGGVTVEIAARLDGGDEGTSEGSDRLWGLSWRVRDADAARARLAADGFDVSEVRTGRKPGTRVLTVRTPTHGVATLLIEPARHGGDGSAG